MKTTCWNVASGSVGYIGGCRSRLKRLSSGPLFKIEACLLAVAVFLFAAVSHLHALASLHHAGHLAVRAHPGFLLAMALPLGQEMLGPAFRAGLVKALTESFTIEHLTVTPMRRRPGSRHVFSFEFIIGDQLTGKRRSIELVGKRDTSRAAGKAAREFDAMRTLWNAGFDRDEYLRIPRPIQFFPDFQLILQGKARGSKLRTFIGKASDVSLGYARMAGLWLAKLHTLKVASPQICTYAHEAASLRTFVDTLAMAQPKLARELHQIAALIEQRFSEFQGVPAAMVHGDFHPDHVFVNKESITLIDFERFSLADPALDLGSFIAHMRTTACCLGREPSATNREIEAFLESYFTAVSPKPDSGILWRIASYVTLSNLEALYYVAGVLRVADPSRLGMYLNCIRRSELVEPASAVLPFALRNTVFPGRGVPDRII